MASAARDKAVSYREKPFLVGSAILVAEQDHADGAERYSTFASHNYTPFERVRVGGAKRCAERNALSGAMFESKNGVVVAITTVSRETSTAPGSDSHDVLHPCPGCRTLLRQLMLQGHVKENTMLCSVNDAAVEKGGTPVVEEVKLKDVLDLYKDDPKVDVIRAAQNKEEWQTMSSKDPAFQADLEALKMDENFTEPEG
ncbi:hypothetical protein HYV73_04190 [Candidatus Uhrbacteria bacterium]|nr:hypothetical protein [Candidatus Uhrbacteria bacterium]